MEPYGFSTTAVIDPNNFLLNWQHLGYFLIPSPNTQKKLIFLGGAVFRLGSRGPFVSAKGSKTIDAQPGLIKFGGRKLFGGRANSLRSDKARLWIQTLTRSRAAGIGFHTVYLDLGEWNRTFEIIWNVYSEKS